jgi:hypothetical protein
MLFRRTLEKIEQKKLRWLGGVVVSILILLLIKIIDHP